MTASKYAKALGLNGLKDMEKACGVQVRTLTNWHREKPDLFRLIAIGILAERASQAWSQRPEG